MAIRNPLVTPNGLAVRVAGSLKTERNGQDAVTKGSAAYYAVSIGEEYQRTKESAARIGRLLIEAKASLPHGEWGKLTGETVEDGRGLLPFSARAAQMFMAIARSPRMTNPNRGADLPISWRIQYELTKLADEQWERGLLEGIIHPQMERQDIKQLLTGDVAHVAHNSGQNEWYTPPDIIQLARQVMGAIDLDPASSAAANEVVGAARFYDLQDNGLEKAWSGRVFLNPPYGQPLIAQFTQKLTAHVRTGEVSEAITLVNNATETGWFQDLLGVAQGVCFPKGRIQFWQPGEEEGTPLQGQAVLYFGSRFRRFESVFSSLGVCRTFGKQSL
ncbi:MAG: DNA N-6-adenine-methyltransferase [Gammaproteobacteria bacterium]